MATKTADQLRTEADALQDRIAELQERRHSLLSQAAVQEQLASLEPGATVHAERRDGSVVPAQFVAYKETDRGILIRVQVGDGFDAELLNLPLSKVSLPEDEE